jgi:sigma-B regulation protein RsbQ
MWRFITPAFEDVYRVILFDYVGCGKSASSCYDPLRYSSLEGYAQDILDICEELHLNSVVFVGHSVSGMIGMLAAKTEPSRFSKILMLGPSACYINAPDYRGGFDREEVEHILDSINSGKKDWAYHLAPLIMGNIDRPQLAAELSTLFCDLDPKVARIFAEATFLTDNRIHLHELTVPTLIMQCSDDLVAPPAAGDYVHQHIKGSVLVKLDATGHMPQMTAPDETINVMKDYLFNDH